MRSNNWDDIYLEDVSIGENQNENIVSMVYKEVGLILLQYTNNNNLSIPRLLHYIKFSEENIFNPDINFIEELLQIEELQNITESLLIQEIMNHEQNDEQFFEQYYNEILQKENDIEKQKLILLQSVKLIHQNIENENLTEFFKCQQFDIHLKIEDKLINEIYKIIKLIQANYIQEEIIIKEEQQDDTPIIKQECIDYFNFKQDKNQPIIIKAMNKEQIKKILIWLIGQNIAIPEIILCAELKSRENGMNLTLNPTQKMLNITSQYYDEYINTQQQNQKEDKVIQQSQYTKQQIKNQKMVEYKILIQMLELVVQQKDQQKQDIITSISYRKLKAQIEKMDKVCSQDCHYLQINKFKNYLLQLEQLYNINQIQVKQEQNQKNINKIDNNNDENLPKQKYTKKYSRLLKNIVKILLIKCAEYNLAIPEIMNCLWFKKHKDKIAEGQMFPQNSVQILPSKVRLIPSLRKIPQLSECILNLGLIQFLQTSDTDIDKLNEYEIQLSNYQELKVYKKRDIVLIEKLLVIVEQQKENYVNQIIEVINFENKVEKIKEQLKAKLDILITVKSNKTTKGMLLDEPLLKNIIKIIEDLQYFVKNQQVGQIILTKHYPQSSISQQEQSQKLGKDELKIAILSSLLSLADHEIPIIELINNLGIKNKTQKFSLQINKNIRFNQYLSNLMEKKQISKYQNNNRLMLKKLKVQNGVDIQIIPNKEQISEPKLIIRSLKILSEQEFSDQFKQIWEQEIVKYIRNQVYKHCSKKKIQHTTIGQICSYFQKIDHKYDVFLNSQL